MLEGMAQMQRILWFTDSHNNEHVQCLPRECYASEMLMDSGPYQVEEELGQLSRLSCCKATSTIGLDGPN